jgi:hypothetical protein
MPPTGGGAPWRSFCGVGRCLLINFNINLSCLVENIIVYAVMADILAVVVYGWYRMVKDDE